MDGVPSSDRISGQAGGLSGQGGGPHDLLLHKGTMEENYSMDKLVRECMESEEPEEKKKKQGDHL